MSDSSKKPGAESAIAALLTCRTIREAAAQCGIGESTLRRWLKESDFRRQYISAKGELLDATKNQLRAAAVEAVDALREVFQDRNAAAGARVGAAKAILELTLKIDEAEEGEDNSENQIYQPPWLIRRQQGLLDDEPEDEGSGSSSSFPREEGQKGAHGRL